MVNGISPPALATSSSPPPSPSLAAALADAGHAVQRDLLVHVLAGQTTSDLKAVGHGASRGDDNQLDLLSSKKERDHRLASPVSPEQLSQSTVPLLCAASDLLSRTEDEIVADPALLASLSSAQHELAQYLSWLTSTATRTTGRRYESAFPASLVTVLWQSAMPPLFHAAAHLEQRQQKAKAGQQEREKASAVDSGKAGAEKTSLQAVLPSEERSIALAFRRNYRDARRALALRTVSLADLLVKHAPSQLVLTLAQMQHCGALSDDVLGPIADALLEHAEGAVKDQASASAQPVAQHHLLSAHHVMTPLSSESSRALLSPSAAITLARLLGRQQAPNHFQLHKLVHTVLLPLIQPELAVSAANLARVDEGKGDVMNSVPPRAALEDLTKCFVHYAVSGSAVEHLATLWQPYLTTQNSSPSEEIAAAGVHNKEGVVLSLSDCANLMRVLTRPPASAAVDTRRRHPGKLSGSASASLIDLYDRGKRQAQHASLVAADEYVPLVEMVCEAAAAQCQRYLQAHTAEMRKVEGQGGEDAAGEARGDNAVTTTDAQQPAMAPVALMNWLLALLKADSPRWAETYSLSATATLVSLSRTVSLSDSASVRVSPASSIPIQLVEQFLYELINRNTHIPDHPLHAVVLRRLLTSKEAQENAKYASTAILALELMAPPGQLAQAHAEASTESRAMADDTGADGHLAIGAPERAAAFQLLRHHDRSLGITAFVAALCVSPLRDLPLKDQGQLLNHFTAVASAVHPAWLARGIVAVTRELAPEVVGHDGISLHTWYTRFTAVDVVRKLNLAQCAGLISVLATRQVHLANNAIALQCIVRRVGALLRSERDADTALEALPSLVPALQDAGVFYAPLFSRMCRLLLSEASAAPWELLLPAFATTADEFMRRSRLEAGGTVFRDVWELVRQRIMADAAESLSLPDLLAAFNGFAALDVSDRPLFLVLTRRLWVVIQDELGDPVRAGEWKCEKDDRSEEERLAHARAEIGRYVCVTLTPSAVAVLTTSLLYKQSGDDVSVILPWTLLTLASTAARELYPIDVVYLMPALLAAFTNVARARHVEAATAVVGEEEEVLLTTLLHRAYDACREQFLLMYRAAEPQQQQQQHPMPEGADSPATSVTPSVTDSAVSLSVVLNERETWSDKVRASVDLVPKRFFATILVELSSSGLRDSLVATACAKKACTARCCNELLTTQSLVDMCMALCVQFPPSPATEAKGDAESEAGAASETSLRAAFMPVVLNALWQRTDELSAEQVNALLRCLRFYYGESVDSDFVARLMEQKKMAEERVTATKLREQPQTPDHRCADTSAAKEEVSATSAASKTESPSTINDSVAELMMESLWES